jgi:hypothetical protein
MILTTTPNYSNHDTDEEDSYNDYINIDAYSKYE